MNLESLKKTISKNKNKYSKNLLFKMAVIIDQMENSSYKEQILLLNELLFLIDGSNYTDPVVIELSYLINNTFNYNNEEFKIA